MDLTNGFKIIGISIRTTNKDNQSAKDLSVLWGRFYAENIIAKIPNKISDNVISLYTDYKSNYTDEYTTIIGVAVSSLDEIPQGFIGREFKADKFQQFIAKGKMPDAVVGIWMDIWQQDKELNRKYSYDFEVYGEKCQAEIPEMEIFVAIR